MSNKVNYIEIKPTHATFLMILSIQKNVIQIKLKKMNIYYIGYMTVKDWKYLRINSVNTSLPYYQQSKWILWMNY